MPRKIRKEHLIGTALTAVTNGMTLRQAAEKFGCSKTTLHTYLHMGKWNEGKPLQQEDILTKSEEERLGNWLIYCYYLGYFKVSHTHVCKEAEKFVKSRGSKRKFSREWCDEFRQGQAYVQKSLDAYRNYRDPDFSLRNKWMGSLIIYCKNQNMFHCLQDPRCMYYCCQLHITDNLKMIIAYSAQGRTAPRLLVNDNKGDIREFEDMLLPQGWYKYNCQELATEREEDNGMSYYIEQILKPHLMQEDLNKPILLFNKYQFNPLTLAFYELCTEYQIYPVNSLLPAFKLDYNLQMDISARMKSITDKQLSNYVDLMKNILMFNMTKQRMCDSFRESGIYPLAVGKINFKELPRVQMSSALESDKISGKCTQPELKNSTDNKRGNSAICQKVEPSETIVSNTLKRKYSELINDCAAVSGEFKNVQNSNIVATPEKQPSSISLTVDKYDQMAFQNFCLDDDDIAVCNEPLNADDSFREINLKRL